MGIHLGRVGHIGIHVSDVDRSIDFYRRVLGLKLTGRWGPPDIGRPICFMRIDDKHHDVVLFELPEDARTAGVAVTDSSLRWARGLDHIVFADNNIASAPARTGDAKTHPIPAAPRVSAPAQHGGGHPRR